jgi:hypothetical protein
MFYGNPSFGGYLNPNRRMLSAISFYACRAWSSSRRSYVAQRMRGNLGGNSSIESSFAFGSTRRQIFAALA